MIAGIEAVLGAAHVPAGEVTHVLHGTTLFTNALIERKGARTALVTTKGFRDAVEIAREHRYDMYDLYMQRPRPIAPRHLRFEIDERILADGTVRRPIDPDEVRRLADRLRAERIEAVGVCLLHAYANPAHERLVGRILREALPEVAVTLSSELVPEIREYERTSTTLANVYVQRLAQRYLGGSATGCAGSASAAGSSSCSRTAALCEAETGGRYPVRLIESGPAAGALAAAALRRAPRPQGPPLLRHGRHHRQGVRDRGRRAAGLAGVRGRPPLPLQEGQRAPDQGPGDRDDRDRHRRRLDRPRRRAAPARGRAGERGRPPRARLLRPRRHRADRDRRRPRARLSRPRLLPRRPDAARPGRGAARDRRARGAAPRARSRRGRLGHPSARQREHGERRAHPRDRARQGRRSGSRSSPSAAPGPCTPSAWPASSGAPA